MSVRARGWWLVGWQFVGIAALVAPIGEPIWQLPPPLRLALQLTGWLAMASLVVAGLTLGRGLTAHPMPVPEGELVTSGLYRWVRHPIYASLLTAACAIALADPTAVRLLSVAGLWGLINLKARFEESLLRSAYPQYAAYASATGRFLPKLLRGR